MRSYKSTSKSLKAKHTKYFQSNAIPLSIIGFQKKYAFNFCSNKKKIACLLATAILLCISITANADDKSHRNSVRAGLQEYDQNSNERLELKRKPVVPKPDIVPLTGKRNAERIIVKFVDGTRIRKVQSRGTTENPEPTGKLEFRQRGEDRYQQKLLRQNRLSENTITQEIEQVNRLISSDAVVALDYLFLQKPGLLERLRQNTERRTRIQASDLSNYFVFKLKNPEKSKAIASALNSLKIVETVYFASKAVKLPDIPPSTPNFQVNQGYLQPAANGGIDAQFAWTISGGNGANITIADIEHDWNLTHEDLPQMAFQVNGSPTGVSSDKQHGTAALSVMVGRNDGAGVTGIAYGARAATVGAFNSNGDLNRASAILTAVLELRDGDIILIEQQSSDHEGDFMPIEYDQAEFDTITVASNAGVIVVEAAGNGGQNLDAGVYDQRFDPDFRNSGAIMVGASNSTNRKATASSNYGKRIDLHGWGNNVMSAGYGTIGGKTNSTMRINGADTDQWYRTDYNGTSSASPIVAGAIAAIQGARLANGERIMGWSSMRKLLVDTGTPFIDAKPIGSFPNLRAALQQMLPGTTNAGGSTNSNQPGPLYKKVISFSNVSTTPVSGVSSTKTDRLYANDSGLRALARLEFGERSDEPCFVKGFRREVTNAGEQSRTATFDECKNNDGPKSGSRKFVPKKASKDNVFIHGIEVCMSKTKNDNRLKGVRLRQSQVTSDGLVERIAGSSATYPELDRPNCKDDWKPAQLCDFGEVATDLVIHHFKDKGGRSVSGIALECREVKVEQVCVENCQS